MNLSPPLLKISGGGDGGRGFVVAGCGTLDLNGRLVSIMNYGALFLRANARNYWWMSEILVSFPLTKMTPLKRF
jgi:hypothetical protein